MLLLGVICLRQESVGYEKDAFILGAVYILNCKSMTQLLRDRSGLWQKTWVVTWIGQDA